MEEEVKLFHTAHILAKDYRAPIWMWVILLLKTYRPRQSLRHCRMSLRRTSGSGVARHGVTTSQHSLKLLEAPPD